MRWMCSHRAHTKARLIADRHYSRQKPGTPQFVPPGSCVVFLATTGIAYWVTSWPLAEYTHHAWAGAWICSAFRNEGAGLSSELIREAVAATRWRYPEIPDLGMVTFVDPSKVRRKRDPGRCFRKAGFVPAICPVHSEMEPECAACHYRTKSGLLVLQLMPDRMPEPEPAINQQLRMFSGAI